MMEGKRKVKEKNYERKVRKKKTSKEITGTKISNHDNTMSKYLLIIVASITCWQIQ